MPSIIFSATGLGETHRELIPFLAFKESATRLRRPAAPLFEEEGHLRGEALVAYINHPFAFHRSRARTAFAASDHPMNAFEIEFADWRNERFGSIKSHPILGGLHHHYGRV